MKDLMRLYKQERTNDYWKDYAIAQIRIAHRFKEYLNPDKYFPPKINKEIMNLFLDQRFEEAVHNIMDDLCLDISSSTGYENIENEAVEFSKELYTEYLKNSNKDLLIEREQLLIKLNEINKNLNISLMILTQIMMIMKNNRY